MFYIFSFCLGYSVISFAEPKYIVEHIDEVTVDPKLSLSTLISQTVEKYPDYALIAAMQNQTEALQQRGSQWIAGAARASIDYRDDFIGSDTGAYELEGAIQVPLWNWGQRTAGLNLAERAGLSSEYKAEAINLEVAGLVRQSLWAIALENLRFEMAYKNLQLTEKLLNTIKLRVDLGDLPKSDYLLAESELLQKKIESVHAEASLMHARKRFFFLTQNNTVPAKINEPLSNKQKIDDSHPAIRAINAVVAQQKAKLEWIKAKGSGQTTLAVGGNMEKPSDTEESVDSIIVGVSIPFGGKSYLAPAVAQAQKQYVEAEIAKRHLYRQLLEQMHEAEHELEIERAQLQIATKMKENAEEHLKMANLSFVEGEINLMDFLKIQARSQNAIKQAEESAIRLQRDIALYNQAVGVAP